MVIEEILISSVAQAVIAIVAEDLAQRPGLAGLREKLQGEAPEKLAFQRALGKALITFAEKHPGIANSLFDDYFLNKPVIHQELAKLLTPNLSPNQELIIAHWHEQLPQTGRQYDIAIPVNDFIQALSGEIKLQPNLRPFVETRIFDEILQRQNDQVALQTDQRDLTAKLVELVEELVRQRPFWKADAEQEALPRPGATSAVLAKDPDDLTEKPRKLFGRDDLLAIVTTLLNENECVLLQGFGGMGKTALAATIAARWIADGKGATLWLKTGSAPVNALMEALARPLNAAQTIARETGAAKAQALRAILRDSVVKLLVLDDCWNGAALFALLKAIPSDLPVLLTARQRYSVGKIRDVGELSRADSLRLLSYHADQQFPVSPTDNYPDALCELLGDHAFAIEIAGKVLKAQRWTPEKLFTDIQKAPHNLTLPLEFAEPGRENVAKLLETSLKALDPQTHNVFLAFGAFFAPALTAEMLALYQGGEPIPSKDDLKKAVQGKNLDFASLVGALTEAAQSSKSGNPDTAPVEKALTTLELHGLVESIPATENAVAHYRLHDLAYSYAAAQAAKDEHHQALEACLAYLERYKQPNLANFAALHPELDNLFKAAEWAFRVGHYNDVRILCDYLYFGDGSGGILYKQRLSVLASGLVLQAVEAASRQGDKRGKGAHLNNLGTIYSDLGQLERAIQYHEQALFISREIGDKNTEGKRLSNLGSAYGDLGQNKRAIEYFEQALTIARKIGDKSGEGNRLSNLGTVYGAQGEVKNAIKHYEQALKIANEIDDKRSKGMILGNLGNVYRDIKDLDRAMDYYQQSISIQRGIGDRMGEANDLVGMGVLHTDQSNYPQAIIYFEQALAIYTDIGAVHLVAHVDRNLAIVRAKMSGAADDAPPSDS